VRKSNGDELFADGGDSTCESGKNPSSPFQPPFCRWHAFWAPDFSKSGIVNMAARALTRARFAWLAGARRVTTRLLLNGAPGETTAAGEILRIVQLPESAT
jgi:hypothetical protein